MKKSIRMIATLGTTIIILFGLAGFRSMSARPVDARPQAAQPAGELRLVARYDLAAYHLVYSTTSRCRGGGCFWRPAYPAPRS